MTQRMRALVDPCQCSVCQGAAPPTPEARELSQCRDAPLPLPLEQMLGTWARLGLWQHSARAMLLQLPTEYGDLCDLYDVARGEVWRQAERERSQRDVVTRMLGGGR